MFNYGDLLRLYVDNANTWMLLGWWAQRTGDAQVVQDAQ